MGSEIHTTWIVVIDNNFQNCKLNVVSSPRFVVCSLLLMCREGTQTWWIWGVYLDMCAGVSITKFINSFSFGGESGDEWPNQKNERVKMQVLPSDEVNKVLYLLFFFIRCCKIHAWLFVVVA